MVNGKIKTAVITGEHPYDVVGFQSMLRTIPEIEVYPQNMWDFITDPARDPGNYNLKNHPEMLQDPARDPVNYEVLLFYNVHQRTPAEEDGKFEAAMKETLEGLGEGNQGIFLLHHALVAFSSWPLWRELSGMRQRGNVPVAFNQTVHIDVANTEHPITATLEPWNIVDETYIIDDADEDSHILLTTNTTNNQHQQLNTTTSFQTKSNHANLRSHTSRQHHHSRRRPQRFHCSCQAEAARSRGHSS